jgi:hypothetical protein
MKNENNVLSQLSQLSQFTSFVLVLAHIPILLWGQNGDKWGQDGDKGDKRDRGQLILYEDMWLEVVEMTDFRVDDEDVFRGWVLPHDSGDLYV